MKNLLLMRHATAESPSHFNPDFDRPLSRQGIDEARQMGLWLNKHQYKPERIIVSPAQRTRQTAEQVVPLMQLSIQPQLQDSLYEARLGDFLKTLAQIPDEIKTVLLIAHNPGLENLLQYLCNKSTESLSMSPATVASLNVSSPWAELENNDAELISLTRPGQAN